MQTTDSELWQRIMADDAEAWATLIRRYRALVYAVATRSGLSLADAADCFQQTWVALFQHRSRIKDPTRLSAWLVTTAKREALRLLRRTNHVSHDDAVPQPVDPRPLPDEELQRLENQAKLESGLKELDLRCRKLVAEFFFAPESRSYEEIARSLGLAPNSLGPIRKRCLARLRKILLKNGFPGVRDDEEVAL